MTAYIIQLAGHFKAENQGQGTTVTNIPSHVGVATSHFLRASEIKGLKIRTQGLYLIN